MPKRNIAEEAGISHTSLNSILCGDSVKLETAEGLAKANNKNNTNLHIGVGVKIDVKRSVIEIKLLNS